MIKIVLDGEPIAQGRMRFFMRGRRAHVYDPQSAIKRDLKRMVLEQLPEDYVSEMKYPRIIFWFYMPIPKSFPKKDRLLASSEQLKHIKKPDVDNLIKLYLDVLSGIVFPDDNCVSLGRACKIYSENPRTEIYIEETNQTISINELYGSAA